MRFAAYTLSAVLLAGSAICSPLSTASTSASNLPFCSQLKPPKIDGVEYLSVDATTFNDVTFPSTSTDGATVPLSYCEVSIVLTHRDAGDKVVVKTWLPKRAAWNGRFQGTGGGGYRAGYLDRALAPAVAKGYSAGSTDAGVGLADTGDFVLDNATRMVNTALLTNFAGRSLHEMSVIGKSLTRDLYAKKPKAYWNGCSTGGRQGYMEAQRYPDDYDGIMASAPAINWARFVPASTAITLFRQKIGYDRPACELTELTRRAIAACDDLDGQEDGIVAAFKQCNYDARTAVGETFTCSDDGSQLTITKEAADIANMAWTGDFYNGQRVWYGVGVGTNLTQVSGQDASYTSYSAAWIRLAIEKDASFDISSLRHKGLYDVVMKSYSMYNDLIGTANPDLSAAYRHGTKILTFHGTVDQAIPIEGTYDYYTRVVRTMKKVNVDDFYRVFTAQGVEHCSGGLGPLPDDALQVLVDWVEKGKAPERLAATTQDERKKKEPLCKFPTLPRYDAKGNVYCKRTPYSDNFRPISTFQRK